MDQEEGVPTWLWDRAVGVVLGVLAVVVVTKGLWAQTGIGQDAHGLGGFLERNWVVIASGVIAAAVGINRLSRLERDYQDLRRDLTTRCKEIDERFAALEERFVTADRFTGFEALMREQHTQVLTILQGLHQSIKEIRANQQARARVGTENP